MICGKLQLLGVGFLVFADMAGIVVPMIVAVPIIAIFFHVLIPIALGYLHYFADPLVRHTFGKNEQARVYVICSGDTLILCGNDELLPG